MTFAVDDEVRMAKLHSSDWHGLSGVAVNLTEHDLNDDISPFIGRRPFLPATDLVQDIPERAKRFFKAEIMSRWPDLSPDDVITLKAERNELIRFLQHRYGLGNRRAAFEVDNLIGDIQQRLRLAAEDLEKN
jgi:hypothetical protein